MIRILSRRVRWWLINKEGLVLDPLFSFIFRKGRETKYHFALLLYPFKLFPSGEKSISSVLVTHFEMMAGRRLLLHQIQNDDDDIPKCNCVFGFNRSLWLILSLSLSLDDDAFCCCCYERPSSSSFLFFFLFFFLVSFIEKYTHSHTYTRK